MGYWIYKTYVRFVSKFSFLSPFLLFLLFLLVSAFLKAFSLATITNVKVAETNTSCLALFFKILAKEMIFSLIKKAFNMRNVFFFFFGNGFDTY